MKPIAWVLAVFLFVATGCDNRAHDQYKGTLDRLRSIHNTRTMHMRIEPNYEDGKTPEEFLEKLQIAPEISFIRNLTVSEKYDFEFTPRSNGDAKHLPVFVLSYKGERISFLNDGTETRD